MATKTEALMRHGSTAEITKFTLLGSGSRSSRSQPFP
jgi:hypothetical protein